MTLFVVQAPGTDEAALVRARFVRDGFSWPAFVFAWAWLLYHRLWLALVIWVVLEVGFIALVLPHVGAMTALLCALLARVFLGLEGNRLRLAKGVRRAALTDLIEARDREEAETIFYRRHPPTDEAAA